MTTTIAIADDHVLLRNGLASLLTDLGYKIIFQADNGQHFIDQLKAYGEPQLAIMDISMPKMDGYDTTAWLKKNAPDVKVLALSMYDDENAIIRMIRNGARGYILKDSDPAELKQAINAILQKGFYHSELVSGSLIHAVNQMDEEGHTGVKELLGLTDKQVEFLKLACTELTFKEIADKMNVSVRTVDGYRDELHEKLQCKTRVGLVLFALKNGIVVL